MLQSLAIHSDDYSTVALTEPEKGLPYVDRERKNQYQREWARRNRATASGYREKTRRRNKDYVRQVRDEGECVVCGEADPAVLDFHHTAPGKEFDISWGMCNPVALSRLQAEIAKCVLMCANCHRKHHHEERSMRGSAAASTGGSFSPGVGSSPAPAIPASPAPVGLDQSPRSSGIRPYTAPNDRSRC